MAKQTKHSNEGAQDTSKRQERAHRILDAAAALILRWGYDKTTIDDIAKRAGVAKGTIYLHWRTREELIMALMTRENLEMSKDLRRRMAEDPNGFMPRGLLKHSALAVMKRPLLKAFMLRDLDIIGKLAHSEHGSNPFVEKMVAFRAYLEFMREHDLVRKDLDVQAQSYMLSAVFTGFFLLAPVMPDEYTLSDEESADLMAETVHRALEPDRPISAEEMKAAAEALSRFLEESMKTRTEQFERALTQGPATG